MKSEHEREALRQYIIDNVVTSGEAIDILGFSRVRLSQIVKMGSIVPIKRGIYLKQDIEEYKRSMS